VKHTAVEVTLTFSEDGFVSARETHYIGDTADATDDYFHTVEFANQVSGWLIGFPRRSYVSDQAAGGGTRLADAWIYYDNRPYGEVGSKGEVTKTERLHEAGNVCVLMAHDPVYGYVISRTDEEGNTYARDYGITDSTRTFVDKESVVTSTQGASGDACAGTIPPNPPGAVTHSNIYSYDRRFGVITSIVSTDSSSFSSEYDGFGRKLKSWTGLGSAQLPNVCYTYSLTSHPLRIMRFDREEYGQGEACGTQGMLAHATFVDGLGRITQEKSEISQGGYLSTVSSSLTFNAEGLVYTRTVPYATGDPVSSFTVTPAGSPSTSMYYDELGRVRRVQRSGVPDITSDYSQWSETVTDSEGKQTEVVRDGFGRVAAVTRFSPAASPYSTTRYEYDRVGRPRFVIDDTGVAQMEYRYDKLGRQSYVYDRDGGHTDLGYWKNGALKLTTDEAGRQKSYLYDEMGRLLQMTRIDSGIQEIVKYRYDESGGGVGAVGNLTSIEDFGSGVRDEYSYDSLGRQTSATRRIGGAPFQIGSTYDALDRPKTATFPDNTQIQYQYGSDGRLSSIPGFASAAQYWPDGTLAHLEYANGIGIDWSIDPVTRWLTSAHAKGLASGSPDILNTSYGYSAGGHLTSISALVGTSSQIFGLDDLYRLRTASGSYGAVTYDYSNLGNLTQKEGTTFQYTDIGHPHRVQSTSAGLQLHYDTTGNATSIVDSQQHGWTLHYDAAGRLQTANHTSGDSAVYLYGPDDKVARRSVSQGGSTIDTVFLNDLYEQSGTSYKKYVYFGSIRIAEWRSDGAKYYYVQDHAGSASVIIDASRNVVQRIEYKPYGEVSNVLSGQFPTTFKYAGSRDDSISGMYDFGSRFYHPALGRFLSIDQVLENPYDTRALNPYGYALGNPVEQIDVGGYSTFGAAFTGLVIGIMVTGATDGCIPCGAAAGGAVSGAITAQEHGQNEWRGALIGSAVSTAMSGIAMGVAGNSAAGQVASLTETVYVEAARETVIADMIRVAIGGATGGFGGILTTLGSPVSRIQDASLGRPFYYDEARTSAPKWMDRVTVAATSDDTELAELSIVLAVAPLPIGAEIGEVASLGDLAGAGTAAARNGSAMVRLGQAGVDAVRGLEDIGPQGYITSGGRILKPDGMTLNVISEVKNSAKAIPRQAWTRQLRSYAAVANGRGLRFDLWLRQGTELSGPLKQAVENGLVNIRFY
jgi:RHS repeat-associated protein